MNRVVEIPFAIEERTAASQRVITLDLQDFPISGVVSQSIPSQRGSGRGPYIYWQEKAQACLGPKHRKIT
jgi:hypothetical protein